jgi:hypothetical protein
MTEIEHMRAAIEQMKAEMIRHDNDSQSSAMRRVIITKYQVYELEPDAQGIPVEEYFKRANLESLRAFHQGAKVYETRDGPVITLPDQPKPAKLEPR